MIEYYHNTLVQCPTLSGDLAVLLKAVDSIALVEMNQVSSESSLF